MVQFVDDKQTVAPGNRVGAALANAVDLRRTEQTSILPSKSDLANSVAKMLWSRLPLARLTDETGHRGSDQVVRLASASHAQIVEWYTDLRKFGDTICQHAIEFRGDQLATDHHRRLFDQIKNEVLSDGAIPLAPRSFIDYRFADLDPNAAIEKAEQHLEQQCLQLANQLIGLLDHLRETSIVGNIQVGESSCQFSFHSRVAIVEQKGPARIHETRKLDPKFAKHWHKAYFVDTYSTIKVTVQHRISTQLHDVRNPVLRAIDETKYPVPQRYCDLFHSFPDWISESVRVLEGDLFRELRVERDTRVDDQTETTLISSEWQRCPALVIGDYVLAGWNDQAIKKEEVHRCAARTAAQLHITKDIASRYDLATKYAGVISIAVMALSLLGNGIFSLLAIILGVAAMHFAWQSAQLRPTSGKSPSTVILHTAYVGCCVFAAQSLIFGLTNVSLLAIGFAAVFAIGARMLSKVSRLKFVG